MQDNAPTPEEARAALAGAETARMKLAAMADCPPWRHAAFGAVMGLLITGAGLPLAWQVPLLVISMAAVVWIKKSDEARYGVFINGYRRGNTLPFTLALLVVLFALMAVQFVVRDKGLPVQVPLAIGFASFLLGTFASVVWSRIFRREMEDRA